MELLNKFKDYLLSNRNKASKATTKNYLADVRKFINWFEKQYQKPFHPKHITNDTIQQYKTVLLTSNNAQSNPTSNLTVSSKSLQRYLSSLRKFFHFLKTEGLINTNPFEQIGASTSQQTSDPLGINEFKNYLLAHKASDLTIKNYILDVKQFLNWASKVLQSENPADNHDKRLLSHITTLTLEEYKTRLRNEARMSPLSINRKLSSIRKYFGWAAEKNYLQETIDISPLQEKNLNSKPSEDQTDAKNIEVPLKLENLINAADTGTEIPVEQEKYASFGPIRLFQKINKGINLIFDLLIILPFTKLIETTGHKLWEANGREVFQPIEKIATFKKTNLTLENNLNSNKINASTQKNDIAKDNLIITKDIKTPRIHNIPKSIYAPLKISTTSFPLHKKIWHHIKHTRPQWYRRYRSYPLSNYFQAAILIIFITAISFSIYRAFFENPRHQNALAALPTSPPRILSFQGRLTDASDNPLTAARPLRFAIYNDATATGAALLWQEIETVTPDQDGIFSTLLGNNVSIPSTLFSQNASLYLGITVGTDTELTPRQQLATVAYAANAETLQGLAPITQAGAGTNNVVLALDSTGNLTIGGSATPTFQASGGQFTLSGQALVLTTNAGSNTNVKIAPDGLGVIDLQKPLQNTSNNNNITSAKGAVEIDDIAAILASSSGQSALTINQTSTGPLISASTSGIAKFTVDNNGLGTFASDLAVNGGNLTTSSTTFNLLNTGAINLNIGGAATAVSIGASSGNTTINNTLLANNGITVASGKSLIVSGNVASSLIPSATNTYDLGSSTNYWNNLYVNNLIANSGATINGFWQRNSGVVSPANITDDLAVGGNATSSAKFQVFGNTGNATTSGNLTFTGTGSQIQSIKNQTLTVGGNSTGDIQFKPGNSSSSLYLASNGNLGIGTTTPRGTMDIADAGSPTLYVGGSNNGGDIIFHGSAANGSGIHYGTQELGIYSDQSNGINFYTNANQARIRIDNSGNVGIGTTNPSSFKLQVAGNVGPDATDTYDLGSASKEWNNLYVKNIVTSATSGQNGFWQLNSGVLAPTNITNDLVIGGIATGSGVFQVFGKSGTTPVASISANTSFAGLVVDNKGRGDLFTASSSGLTRFVITQNGGVGVGSSFISDDGNGFGGGSGVSQFSVSNTTSGKYAKIIINGPNPAGGGGEGLELMGNGATQAEIVHDSSAHDLEINNRTNGEPIIFQTNNGSFAERMRIDQNGNIGIGTTSFATANTKLQLLDSAATDQQPITVFGDGSDSNRYQFLADRGGGGVFYMTSGAGAIRTLGSLSIQNNNTTNLYVSGTGNVGIGTTSPLNSTGLDIEKNSLGNAALVVNNSGGSGDIFTASSAGTPKFVINANGYVGVGTTKPLTNLDVENSANTGTYAFQVKQNDANSYGAYIFADSNSSTLDALNVQGWNGSSVINGLDVKSNGNVGIGTTAPSDLLTVAGNQSINGGELSIRGTAGTNTSDILIQHSGSTSSSNIQYALSDRSNNTDFWLYGYDGTNFWDPIKAIWNGGNNNQILSLQSDGGSLGVGTISPLTKSGLDVEKNSLGNATLVVNNSGGSGDIFTASSSGTTKLVIDKNGNIGDGTSLPSGRLDVIGSTPGSSQNIITAYSPDQSLSMGFGWDTAHVTLFANNQSIVLEGPSIFNAGGYFDNGNQNLIDINQLSIGATGPQASAGIDVQKNSLGNALVNLNNLGTIGDLITASSAGTTKFTVSNNGDVLLPDSGHLYFTNNSGFSPDGTNFALYSSPGGGETALNAPFTNSALTFKLGNAENMRLNSTGFGIGTTGPAFKLDVRDSQSATAAAQIFNTNTGTNADGLIIKLGNTSTTAVNASNHFISFETSGIGIVGSIEGNGNKTINYKTSGVSDFAEYMKKDPNESIPWGSLLCLGSDGYVHSCDNTNKTITGIASQYPTFTGGEDLGNKSITVGLSGLVNTLVSNENGSIKPGDLITVSSLPGIGMKATSTGTIVGKAVEGFDGNQNTVACTSQTNSTCGKILVVVNVSWYNPSIQLTDNGNLNIASTSAGAYTLTDANGNLITSVESFAQAIIANIRAGIIQTQKLTTDTLAVTTENITIGGQTLRDYIASIVTDTLKNQNTTTGNSKLLNPVDNSKISLNADNNKINIYADKNASGSAVASIDNQGNASFSGTLNSKNLQTQDATISGTLHVKNLIADNIAAATVSATYINNITNIYNSIATPSAAASAAANPTPTPTTALAASSSANINPADYTPSTDVPLNTDYSDISSMAGLLSYAPNLSKTGVAQNSLSDVSVAGQLSVGASMILADNSINTLGADLQVEPLRQGNVQFEGGLIAIDTDGNLNVGGNAVFAKDVTVKGTLAANLIAPVPDKDLIIKLGNPSPVPGQALAKAPELKVQNASGSSVFDLDQLGNVIASGSGRFAQLAANALNIVKGAQADTSLTETVATSSAGTAVITANETQRTIVSPFVNKNSLIYLTATSDTQGVTPYVARQTEENPSQNSKGSFTIQIPYPVTKDIHINWWIVN